MKDFVKDQFQQSQKSIAVSVILNLGMLPCPTIHSSSQSSSNVLLLKNLSQVWHFKAGHSSLVQFSPREHMNHKRKLNSIHKG